MIKLNPCPFCGEDFAVVSESLDGNVKKYQVVCDDSSWRKGFCEGVFVHGCGGSTGYYATRSDAIDAWNTRANVSRPMTLEELTSCLRETIWFEDNANHTLVQLTQEEIAMLVFFGLWNNWSGYGTVWRCWTAKPTEAQRKAVKWNE